jgi:hypothetical protein
MPQKYAGILAEKSPLHFHYTVLQEFNQFSPIRLTWTLIGDDIWKKHSILR